MNTTQGVVAPEEIGRSLALATQAGFVEDATLTLEERTRTGEYPERTLFFAGAIVLSGLDSSEVSKDRTRANAERISIVMGELATRKPVSKNRAISEDDMSVVLQRNYSNEIKNFLLTSLISRDAITSSLKDELGLTIPDEAYDRLLESLTSQDNEASGEISNESPLGFLEPDGEIDVSSLTNASSIPELLKAYETHPNLGSQKLDHELMRILDDHITGDSWSYADSLLIYRDYRSKIDSEDPEKEALLKRALDFKLISELDSMLDSGDCFGVIRVIETSELCTEASDEDYKLILDNLERIADQAISMSIEDAIIQLTYTGPINAVGLSKEQRDLLIAEERARKRQQ